MKLRPHQTKAIDMVRHSMIKGNKRVVLAAPCSFGKTITAAAILKSAAEKGKRGIFICDRVKLVRQALESFDSLGLHVGVIQGQHYRSNPHAPIQVASIQTLSRRSQLPEFDIAIVDECHTHYDGLTKMMEAYNAVPFIGLSATPYSKGLGKHYSDLVVPVTTRQLLDGGFLCPIEYYGGRRVDTKGLKKRAIPTGGTDYDPKALAQAVEADTKLVGDIVQNWLRYGEGRQTIAFSPSIKHSQELVEMFNSAGIPAVHIDGYMDEEEREEIFKAHDHGEFKILSCSRLLNTGYDAPSVSCLIDCFPTSSKIVLQQRYGRVQRIFEGKDKAIVLDHAGNVHEHGYIEDFVPEALDDGEKQFNERNQLKEKKEPKTNDCPQCHKIFMGLRCACGYEIVITAKLESDDQVLQKINGKIYTGDDKARWLAELKLYARAKGFKDGWAMHKFKEKFKEWPKVKIQQATAISQDVKGFIQHSNIKRAKGAAA